MSTPREYLLDRFRTDAAALRQRGVQLRAIPRGSAPPPGPDAATSERMAAACEDVVAMIGAIPAGSSHAETANALAAMLPLLEQRAVREAASPPTRAVFAGAATRIREMQEAEARAAAAAEEPLS